MSLGPRPRGDPGAMRREADRLRDQAGRIAHIGRSLPDVPTDMFRGPAGERLRASLADRRHAIERAASSVREAADRLSSEAARVEASIRAWEDEQRRQQERLRTARR